MFSFKHWSYDTFKLLQFGLFKLLKALCNKPYGGRLAVPGISDTYKEIGNWFDLVINLNILLIYSNIVI